MVTPGNLNAAGSPRRWAVLAAAFQSLPVVTDRFILPSKTNKDNRLFEITIRSINEAVMRSLASRQLKIVANETKYIIVPSWVGHKKIKCLDDDPNPVVRNDNLLECLYFGSRLESRTNHDSSFRFGFPIVINQTLPSNMKHPKERCCSILFIWELFRCLIPGGTGSTNKQTACHPQCHPTWHPNQAQPHAVAAVRTARESSRMGSKLGAGCHLLQLLLNTAII